MRKMIAAGGLLALTVAIAQPAQAQGLTRGVSEGARHGQDAAGPVGAVVGGVVGGVTGAIGGLLGADQRPRFREYVINEHRPSYHWRGDVRVGVVLPVEGVEYYDVPPEFGVRGYRYAVINDETVLVDPRTMRIVEVVG